MRAPKRKTKRPRPKLRRIPAQEKDAWIGLKEAAKAIGLSKVATLRLRSPSFRIEKFRADSARVLRWFVNAHDLERERLRRCGPKDYELEREVIAAMTEGRSPIEVMQRLPFVTLSDLERVQQQHARVVGTIVLNGQQSQEVAMLLGIDGVISAETIVREVRAARARIDRLASELHAPRQLPEKAPEEQKTNGERHEAAPARSAASL